MAETDHHLVHLQSFTSNPSYSNIPDIIKKGMPLFYLPQNSSNPEVNLQQQSSKYVKWSGVEITNFTNLSFGQVPKKPTCQICFPLVHWKNNVLFIAGATVIQIDGDFSFGKQCLQIYLSDTILPGQADNL